MDLNETIRSILVGLTSEVYLYTAKPNQKAPYIVYGVDGANDLTAENAHSEDADQGFIDLYTKDAKDALIKSIPEALNENEISYYLNSVQYEDETGLLHFEWIWEE